MEVVGSLERLLGLEGHKVFENWVKGFWFRVYRA